MIWTILYDLPLSDDDNNAWLATSDGGLAAVQYKRRRCEDFIYKLPPRCDEGK